MRRKRGERKHDYIFELEKRGLVTNDGIRSRLDSLIKYLRLIRPFDWAEKERYYYFYFVISGSTYIAIWAYML